MRNCIDCDLMYALYCYYFVITEKRRQNTSMIPGIEERHQRLHTYGI